MQSSSKIAEYEQQVTTDLQRAFQDAGLVLEDWQMPSLEYLVTTRELPVVLRSMQRRTLFSTAIEKIFRELPSTSPENPATPARS